jgi:exoribonuclease II
MYKLLISGFCKECGNAITAKEIAKQLLTAGLFNMHLGYVKKNKEVVAVVQVKSQELRFRNLGEFNRTMNLLEAINRNNSIPLDIQVKTEAA